MTIQDVINDMLKLDKFIHNKVITNNSNTIDGNIWAMENGEWIRIDSKKKGIVIEVIKDVFHYYALVKFDDRDKPVRIYVGNLELIDDVSLPLPG